MIWQRAVALVNARVVTPRGMADAIRFTSRILSVGDAPQPGDLVLDGGGGLVLPGLINAHDHLELNHYSRLKFRDRYGNVSEWIADMGPRIADDLAIRIARGRPLTDRLFIGALKNLLSGVTTVAHHNPFYAELRRQMPIRVLRRYGWAHSFLLQDRPAGARGEPGGDVQDRFRSTSSDVPFFLHLAEGVDAAAHDELGRLQQIGCLASNTVLVHAIAIDDEGWRAVGKARASVVWCPASNMFLFGQTIDVARNRQSRLPVPVRVALGTDSRLTGSRDVLDELRCACQSSNVAREDLLAMVTATAADVIGQPQLGRLYAGAPADLILLPGVAREPIDTLLAAARRDLRLVVAGGRPMIADRELEGVFAARSTEPGRIDVDGVEKLADARLVERIAGCSIAEPGVAAA